MLNDPAVLEASRVLAQQLSRQSAPVPGKITEAFRRIICRKPSAKELQLLQDYYKEQLDLFNQRRLDASLTLRSGEYPQRTGGGEHETAALMKTVNTIYNMEEAIVK